MSAFNQYSSMITWQLLAISYWLLAIGYWLLASSEQLLAIGYQLLASSWQLVAGSQQLVASSWQLVASSQQLVASSYQLVASSQQLVASAVPTYGTAYVPAVRYFMTKKGTVNRKQGIYPYIHIYMSLIIQIYIYADRVSYIKYIALAIGSFLSSCY